MVIGSCSNLPIDDQCANLLNKRWRLWLRVIVNSQAMTELHRTPQIRTENENVPGSNSVTGEEDEKKGQEAG